LPWNLLRTDQKRGEAMACDPKINSAVRSILFRHWIDVNQVAIRHHKGNVRLLGTLRLLPGTGFRQSQQKLNETLEQEIRRVPGVKRVRIDQG
jgi:hypothetical protein